MSERFTTWDVAQDLSNEEDMALFLNACIDDDPGDGSLIRHGLGAMARARGMTQLARKTGISREGLYRALSPEGNPEFATIIKVTRALGLRLQAQI